MKNEFREMILATVFLYFYHLFMLCDYLSFSQLFVFICFFDSYFFFNLCALYV